MPDEQDPFDRIEGVARVLCWVFGLIFGSILAGIGAVSMAWLLGVIR